jgi:hypothetical protein
VTRANEEHIALADPDAVLAFGCLELAAEDVLARLEPRQSSETRDVEEDPSGHQTVREHLD